MDRPDFTTAVPKRRYRLGAFTVVILGDVESKGTTKYQFILASVSDGASEPGLYLTVEKPIDPTSGSSNYDLRLTMQDGSAIIDSSQRWNTIEGFTEEALQMVQAILSLQDEEPRRLL